MKAPRFLLSLLLIVSLACPTRVEAGRRWVPAISQASESSWQGQLSDNDYFDGSSTQIVSQGVKAAVAKNVTKTRLKLWAVSGTAQVKLQLRTAANGGGTQLGADSITVTVNTTPTVYDLTFATPVAVSADFFLNVVGLDNAFRVGIQSGNPYEDTSYYGWQGASGFSTYDLYFEIFAL